MRLTLVFRGCHPRGGVERVVWESARHLSERHEVVVVTADVDKLPANVEVRLTPADPTLTSFRRDATAAIGADPGLVVSFGSDCPPSDVLVMQSVHRAWTERGSSTRVGPLQVPNAARRLLPRHRVRLSMERDAIQGVRHKIVVVAAGVADDLTRMYAVPAERMAIVPNGFDPDQCSPQRSASERERMRQELGLAGDDLGLLLVANEYHRKGLKVLLEAMHDIADPRLHLLLVGRMSPDAYQHQIEHLGLAARVRYCGPTSDVALYYAAADLFVLPTQYEAFGTVIVEALACGLPVITTSLAGAAEAVQPGINGLLQQDPLDAGELGGLLRTGLDLETRKAWADAASPSVAGYEWSSVVRRFEKVLVNVANGQ